jgi:predicted XRE-type DNA-binding protein
MNGQLVDVADLVSESQAARIIGISQPYVSKLVKSGTLKLIAKLDYNVVLSRAQCEAFKAGRDRRIAKLEVA